jgi:hypothetical protein
VTAARGCDAGWKKSTQKQKGKTAITKSDFIDLSSSCARPAELSARISRYADGKIRKREVAMGNLLYWAIAFLIFVIGAALEFFGMGGTAIESAALLF